eukprot:771770-Pyramimonas_sp.AAC.1
MARGRNQRGSILQFQAWPAGLDDPRAREPAVADWGAGTSGRPRPTQIPATTAATTTPVCPSPLPTDSQGSRRRAPRVRAGAT